MKINNQETLKDLNGDIVKDSSNNNAPITVGKAIAGILTTPKQNSNFDPLKAYTLAQKFYSDKEVDLDEADMISLKKEIKENKGSHVVISGQLLKILNNIK